MMDPPSTKRRRLSGSSMGPVSNPSSPRKTPTRASFMSPTRASLSRFNPTLLKSPSSVQQWPRRPPSRLRDHVLGIRRSPEVAEREEAPTRVQDQHEARRADAARASPERRRLFDDLDLDALGRIDDVVPDEADLESVVETRPEDAGEEQDPVKVKEKQDLMEELRSLRVQLRKHERAVERGRGADGRLRVEQFSHALLTDLLDDRKPDNEKDPAKRPISRLLDSFLPFARPAPAPAKALEDDSSVASHRPVELKDPLPCLQLFTPLSVTSSMDPPRPRAPGSHRINQTHHIHLQGPSSLFVADVDVTISSSDEDATAPSVDALSVQCLSSWALPELSSWIKACCDSRDAGALFYGLGGYYELASRRAQCWTKCEAAFGHLLAKSKHDEKENEASRPVEGKLRRSFLSRLGKSSIQPHDDQVVLRICWVICFDWTGEAQSQVSANAAFAGLYHDNDDRGSLNKVSSTFYRLVASKGVFAAVEGMAAILFG